MYCRNSLTPNILILYTTNTLCTLCTFEIKMIANNLYGQTGIFAIVSLYHDIIIYMKLFTATKYSNKGKCSTSTFFFIFNFHFKIGIQKRERFYIFWCVAVLKTILPFHNLICKSLAKHLNMNIQFMKLNAFEIHLWLNANDNVQKINKDTFIIYTDT